MKEFIYQKIAIIAIVLIGILFFNQVFLGRLPIAADTIVGLYHPFRDSYATAYPNGVPFKNFLVTDPVRQQYPWKHLVVGLEKKFQIPLWNPYSFAGSPLLANIQSSPWYPFNLFYLFLPMAYAWTLLIMMQPILAALFLYLYLRKMHISPVSSVLGAITFAFCGFSIAWMEWNTVTQVVLWLPLILFLKEKLIEKFEFRFAILLIIAEVSALLAGHLQVWFYTLCISNVYLFARLGQVVYNSNSRKEFFKAYLGLYARFLLIGIIVFIITAVQWVPAIQFIILSARDVDQNVWQRMDWFLPWQNLIQFVAPDFLGNPATLNYFGIWNYAEFVGYIGIIPCIFSIFALFFRRDKKTLFFGTLFFVSLIFALPTPIAKIPFQLHIPFLATSQPSRLLFITDFSLSILAALGFDYFLKAKKEIYYPLAAIGILFGLLWLYVLFGNAALHFETIEQLAVSKRNLIFPTILYGIATVCIILMTQNKRSHIKTVFAVLIVMVVVYDLFRFGWKFLPFTKQDYLYPQSAAVTFLQKNSGFYRIMAIDDRILPPNFSVMYQLQDIAGYDPLYPLQYAEFTAALERGKPDINPPFGYNRIITPHNYHSRLVDLLGVKYIISLAPLTDQKLQEVFRQGQTIIYENRNVLPRTFFVKNIHDAKIKQQAMDILFGNNFDHRTQAVVQSTHYPFEREWSVGKATILSYDPNKVVIETENQGTGFLLLTDSFYPTWRANIYNVKEGPGTMKRTTIYHTDYNFRGVIVPAGKNMIVFSNTLF